jgi:hypothetical protein
LRGKIDAFNPAARTAAEFLAARPHGERTGTPHVEPYSPYARACSSIRGSRSSALRS